MSHFHPLEVEGRGSETQLQVDEKLNLLKYFITEVDNIYCVDVHQIYLNLRFDNST